MARVPALAQQLREATPFGQAFRFLIRDNDSKFGLLVEEDLPCPSSWRYLYLQR